MREERFRERTLAEHIVHAGKLLTVRVDEVLLPDGRRAVREVVRHPGAVVVVACPGPDRILLVNQFRYAIGRMSLELPAGKLDPGEQPAAAALRELAEETGWRAQSCRLITLFYSTPGFSDERMYLFEAENLSPGAQQPDDDEWIECREYTRMEARELLGQGEIVDAKTWVGLLWWLGRP